MIIYLLLLLIITINMDIIKYSDKYKDEMYEYRHVTIPPNMRETFPQRLLSEDEWRKLGICQSRGWVHYMLHKPEPHVLCFRRKI